MTSPVAQLISEASREGIELALFNDQLYFRSARPLPPDLHERLKARKTEIVQALGGTSPMASKEKVNRSMRMREPQAARAFVADELRRLRAADQHDDAIEARFRWRERAAICEYDGGLPRVQAESIAAADLGALDHPGAGLIPDGWTRERWAARLEQMAEICIVPERAAELRLWRAKVLSEAALRRV